MKYDASMTQFHGDIVAAVKLMCGKDTDARSNSEGASPAPLRDYLKKQYGYNGKCSNGVMYQNIPSKGMEIKLDREVDNNGDMTITLSWSQVAKFIRDNPSEIFGEENSSENAGNSSPIEAKTYLEIFKEHYPNVNCSELYDDYCPGDFFEGAKEVQHKACPNCPNKCESCWNIPANEEWCETVDSVPEGWKTAVEPEHKEEEQEFPAEISAPVMPELPIPQTDAEEIAESFNYTLLSAELGDYLRHKEEQLKNEYMSFTANCGRIFAEAQERLAKHGFGENNGVFEKWITSMGFSKKTVYRMMDIFKFRSCQIDTNEGKAFFDTLPKTLQYDISAKSAPPELVEQVMNGDITTHKEYIELKKQLEEAESRAEAAERNVDKLRENNQKMRTENIAALVRADKAEKQLKELESRPVEVAVDVDELNRRVEKVSIELQNQTARQIAAEREDFARKLNSMEDENDELRAELEKAKAAKTNDNVKTVLMRMTLDELAELAEVVPVGKFKTIIKKAQVIRA